MSEEEKCREAFEREYSMLTGVKRAHAWSVWTTCWHLRQQAPDGYAVVPVGAIGKFTAAGRSINPIAVSTLVREGLAIMDAMKPEDVK